MGAENEKGIQESFHPLQTFLEKANKIDQK
jgi:hypothetical protein